MRLRTLLMLIIPTFSIAPSLAADNNCQPVQIQNWKPEWNRPNCAEMTVTVEALGAKTDIQAPRCAKEDDLADSKKVMDVLRKTSTAVASGTGAKVGTAVGGPIGTVVGAVIGAAGAEGLKSVIKNNYHVKYSVCTDVCVHLPVNATNVMVQGWSGPSAGIDGIALCDMTDKDHPGICGLPGGRYDAMSLYNNQNDNELGQVYCSTAMNWSEDQKPTLGLRVMYDKSE